MPSSPSQLLEGVVLPGRHHQQQQQQQETPQQTIRQIQPQDHHLQVHLHLPWLLLLHRLEKAGSPSQVPPIYDNIHCTHPQVSGYILYKDLRERNLPGPREPGGAYLPKEHVIGNNFCYRCGFWYKKNHSLSTCDTKRGVRMKGVVSFAHGDISIGQNQGGEQQEIVDDLPHTLKVGISDALRTSVLKRSSVILTPSRRSPSL